WHMLEHAGDYDRSDWQPARSARRFECGSPNMLGAMALEASLSLLEEVGMNTVAARVEERMLHLQQGLQGIHGANLHSPLLAARRAGILTFSLDGWDNQVLFARLKAEQVICAQRGAGIRFSPHFYTDHAVIDQTLVLLGQLAQG
ncbi:MAG: aminotransferase class V-fold PLP-dependent enzyme, partial [Pseudomonas sp.]